MRATTKLAIVSCLVFLTASISIAQNEPPKPPTKFFHLEFTVKEIDDGKAPNARSYSMMASTDRGLLNTGSIRTGSRVPFEAAPGQIQFMELGVNIDCRAVQEIEGQLGLTVIAEISSVASDAGSSSKPVLRQTKWNSSVMVPMRKATVIFSSDDVTGKRKMQLELTATPVK
jgi:hypothetical protein